MNNSAEELLLAAYKALKAEYDEWEDRVKTERLTYHHRLSMMETLMTHTEQPVPVPTNGTAKQLSVSDAKLASVRSYMHEHKQARQAEVSEALRLNSGTVSVALRRLEMDGEIRPLPTEQGSKFWEVVAQ